MNKGKFEKILDFCLSSGYCQYQGDIYSQKNGLAIGIALSPIVAELVLDHLFREMDRVFKTDEIKFNIKYVDDSFFILRSDVFDQVLYTFLMTSILD